MAELRRTLSGWGRTMPTAAHVVRPSSTVEVEDLVRQGSTALIARGLGRSYGDPAQLGRGIVLDSTAFDTISPVDPTTHEVTVGAGVSLDALLHRVLPLGYFVPVTPGTRQVTVGGAIAFDIHGKNHHVDGSFGAHVRALTLVTPTGTRTIGPDREPDLFWATVGGMGLTGVITSATVSLLPISSPDVLVDTTRHGDLDAVMAAMVEGDADSRYSVAWVDCMTRGASMGRAVLTRGDHATGTGIDADPLPRKPRLAVPFNAPPGLLNRASISAFNEAWFRSSPTSRVGERQSISTFFHPLDGVANWNRLYGPRGFVQYQFVVPDESAETVRRAVEALASAKVSSFLAVLKRFGPSSAGLLSFPMAGWTLALDLPVGNPALPHVLDELDDEVAAAGGRIYLAKDARLHPRHVGAMYPNLDRFRAVADAVDPAHRCTSDLAVRLNLRGALRA